MKLRLLLMAALMAVVLHPLRAQLLWEISGNGLPQKSYLFGTCKLVPTTFLDSVPQLLKAYAHCQQVVTETALSNVDAQADLAAAALLPDSVSYPTLLTAAEYEMVSNALSNYLKMSSEQWTRIRPVLLCEYVKEELFRQRLGYDARRSSDQFFLLVAREQGRPIVGLDNLSETIYASFFREPVEQQAHELVNAIVYPDREVEQAQLLLQAYRQGDLTDMAYAILRPDNKTSIGYADYQVYAHRNIRWAKQLRNNMMQNSCFVMLDATYLGGDGGLIVQLKKAGYKVKAVR